jgi:ribosomal protein L16
MSFISLKWLPKTLFTNKMQIRTAVSNFRPKKMKYKKAFKGNFKSHPDSLKGTTCYLGDYGLQVVEGGRLTDVCLDVARTGIRRAIKPDKEAQFFLRVFPDRPVTAKAAETRMGKGKGKIKITPSFQPNNLLTI